MGARRVETRITARAHVDHRRNVVLDERFINRIPVSIGQRRRRPMSSGRIRVQVDGDEPVLLDAALQLRKAGLRVHAGRLRQHAAAGEGSREEIRHTMNQLIADGGPRRTRLESADMVRHEARAGREDREVGPALAHELQLILLDALAQLIVADAQFRNLWGLRWIGEPCDLAVAPVLQRLGCGRVVAVAIDDHVRRTPVRNGGATSARDDLCSAHEEATEAV